MKNSFRNIALFLPLAFLISCQEEPASPIVEAHFELDTDIPRISNQIRFLDVPAGARKYAWDFGNGSTSSERYPEEVFFEQVGTYTISLTTTSLDGQTDIKTKQVNVGAFYTQSVTMVPSANLKNLVTEGSKLKLVALQKIDHENIPVFESEILNFGENWDTAQTISLDEIAFGQRNKSLGFPIFRLFDESTGELIGDSEYSSEGKFLFEKNANQGVSITYSDSNNPLRFELEFNYGFQ